MTGNATLAVSRMAQLLVTWTSIQGCLWVLKTWQLPRKLALQRLEGRNHNGMTYDLPLALILHHTPQYHFGYPDQYVLMWHGTIQGNKQEEKTSIEAIFKDDYHSRLQGFNCKCLNIRRTCTIRYCHSMETSKVFKDSFLVTWGIFRWGFLRLLKNTVIKFYCFQRHISIRCKHFFLS